MKARDEISNDILLERYFASFDGKPSIRQLYAARLAVRFDSIKPQKAQNVDAELWGSLLTTKRCLHQFNCPFSRQLMERPVWLIDETGRKVGVIDFVSFNTWFRYENYTIAPAPDIAEKMQNIARQYEAQLNLLISKILAKGENKKQRQDESYGKLWDILSQVDRETFQRELPNLFGLSCDQQDKMIKSFFASICSRESDANRRVLLNTLKEVALSCGLKIRMDVPEEKLTRDFNQIDKLLAEIKGEQQVQDLPDAAQQRIKCLAVIKFDLMSKLLYAQQNMINTFGEKVVFDEEKKKGFLVTNQQCIGLLHQLNEKLKQYHKNTELTDDEYWMFVMQIKMLSQRLLDLFVMAMSCTSLPKFARGELQRAFAVGFNDTQDNIKKIMTTEFAERQPIIVHLMETQDVCFVAVLDKWLNKLKSPAEQATQPTYSPNLFPAVTVKPIIPPQAVSPSPARKGLLDVITDNLKIPFPF